MTAEVQRATFRSGLQNRHRSTWRYVGASEVDVLGTDLSREKLSTEVGLLGLCHLVRDHT